MTVRVLLTGGGGFVGRRLNATLRARNPDWLIEAPARADGPYALDVTDPQAVDAWMRARRPDIVIHLAAVSAVTAAVSNPRQAWRVNLDGALNVVLALQAHAPAAQLMLVSSAEVYGRSLDATAPVSEAAALKPVNPYAASKAAADILVGQAAASGLFTLIMRPFNHTGPGQSDLFVVPSFASQLARIEAGMQPPELVVGSLDEERDFLDVDDVTDAYADVLDARGRLPSGEVLNVASGRAVRIGDILERLLALSTARVSVRVEASRLRARPIARIVGDASRLRHAVAWRPRRPLEDTLAQVLHYERRRVAAVFAPSAVTQAAASAAIPSPPQERPT